MNRRNFIKSSALSASFLALVPSALVADENIECNAFISGNYIVFKGGQDFRVGDWLIVSDGNKVLKGILKEHIEKTKFSLVFYDEKTEGNVVALTIVRDFNLGDTI